MRRKVRFEGLSFVGVFVKDLGIADDLVWGRFGLVFLESGSFSRLFSSLRSFSS